MTSIFRVCMCAFALLSTRLLAEDAPAAAPAAAAPAEGAAEVAADDGDEAVGKKVPPFERYKTIVDRKPFGREPANFNPDAPSGSAAAAAAAAAAAEDQGPTASEEEQRILSSVRVSVLNVTPGHKVAVGFTDSSKSPAVNYYLIEGETRDGWTVKSANVSERTIVLSQNGVDVTIPLGGGNPNAGKGGKPGGRPQGAMRPVAAAAGGGENVGAPGGAFAHLRARRLRKEADQKAEAEAAAAAAAQEKADREQAAADREQQRAALLQIQEELRRQREERQSQSQSAAGDGQTQE